MSTVMETFLTVGLPSTVEMFSAQPSTAQIFSAQPSTVEMFSAQPSTTFMFDPTAYQTLTNSNTVTIPTGGPYDFNDGFVSLTEDVLQNMSLDELIGYSNVVSTSAGLEYSTILANQAIQSQYDLLIQLSQSTIDGLSYELQLNDAEKFKNAQRQSYLYEQSTLYVSTIAQYEMDISTQSNIILTTTSTIDALTYESGIIDSTIAKEDSDFVSSAKGYSTLYYTFLGWDAQLRSQICTIKEISSILENDIRSERAAYENLLDKTQTWVQKSGELSTLYDRDRALRSTLTQQEIDEATAVANHSSTLYGISTLSTMYKAAVANRNYAISLSTLASLTSKHSRSVVVFTEADLAYTNSIGQTGGKQRGGAVQGDTTLWTARNMASTSMATALYNKKSSEDTTSALRTLAGIANTDLYDATLANLEGTVISKIRLVDTMVRHKEEAIKRVETFSSIYEAAALDMSTYDGLIKMYSTFYESSMVAASTLTGLADEDDATIEREQREADRISWRMSSLGISYDEYTSSYNGYILLSSFYTKRARDKQEEFVTCGGRIEEGRGRIREMSVRITSLDREIMDNNVTIFTQSSIINSEKINLAKFDMQIKDSLNMQERASYEYRETFCRLKRIDLQNSYESQVLNAIKAASTMSGQMQAANPGVRINPTPVNLNTPPITNVYTSLTSINSFLDTFTNIYKVYDAQNVNIQSLSTSIGAESNSWSTLLKYDSDNFYSVIIDPSLQSRVNTEHANLLNSQMAVAEALRSYTNKQGDIASAKSVFTTGYSSFFTQSEIANQEVEISSFMITGYKQAIENMLKQGILFSF
jgi:hypothetical protein